MSEEESDDQQIPIPLPDHTTVLAPRIELVRVLLDALTRLGYSGSARALEAESKVDCVGGSPSAQMFLDAVREGRWWDAVMEGRGGGGKTAEEWEVVRAGSGGDGMRRRGVEAVHRGRSGASAVGNGENGRGGDAMSGSGANLTGGTTMGSVGESLVGAGPSGGFTAGKGKRGGLPATRAMMKYEDSSNGDVRGDHSMTGRDSSFAAMSGTSPRGTSSNGPDAIITIDSVPFKPGGGKEKAKAMIARERFVSALENGNIDVALNVLANGSLDAFRMDQLEEEDYAHVDEIAVLLACPNKNELLSTAQALREAHAKRFKLGPSLDHSTALDGFVALIDPDAVVPPNRLLTLFGQALAFQTTKPAVEASTTTGSSYFGANESVTLVKEMKEVEDARIKLNLPSTDAAAQIMRADSSNSSQIWTTSFSPSGSRLAIGTQSGTVIVYRVVSGGKRRSSSSSSSVLASTGDLEMKTEFENANEARQGSEVRLEECERHVDVFKNNSPICFLDWSGSSNDEVLIVSGTTARSKNTPLLLSHRSGSLVVELRTRLARTFPSRSVFHDGEPCAKWLDEVGNQVVTTGPDGWLKFWTLSPTGHEFICKSAIEVERVSDIVVCRTMRGTALRVDGVSPPVVIAACADRCIRFFTGTSCTLSIPVDVAVVSLAIRENTLAVVLENESLAIWNLATLANKSLRGTDPDRVIKNLARNTMVITPSVGFSNFVACGDSDGVVHIWSCSASSVVEVAVLKGHIGSVNQVVWNPAIRGHLISVGDDGRVRSWCKSMGLKRRLSNSGGANLLGVPVNVVYDGKGGFSLVSLGSNSTDLVVKEDWDQEDQDVEQPEEEEEEEEEAESDYVEDDDEDDVDNLPADDFV